jgi:hypothetical protein
MRGLRAGDPPTTTLRAGAFARPDGNIRIIEHRPQDGFFLERAEVTIRRLIGTVAVFYIIGGGTIGLTGKLMTSLLRARNGGLSNRETVSDLR